MSRDDYRTRGVRSSRLIKHDAPQAHMGRKLFLLTCASTALLAATSALATESADASTIQGIDVTNIVLVGSTLLALVLSVISLLAYRRDGRKKLLFVTIAFGLFALKGVLLLVSDWILLRQPYLDVLASLLDFAVLLSFFVGMLKK